jgi:acetyl-CoA carboxylase biotin carboxylase subunit
MNTRLQVEHPVTELVTGLDLVEQQIRIAAGEELAFRQSDVIFRGHAIEVRINAEDPAKGFVPATGVVAALEIPTGPGVRFDGAIYQGMEALLFYDPMLAKLIVWGSDRDHALRRMRSALSELSIAGLATSASAAIGILAHPRFVQGRYDTHFLESFLEEICAAPALDAKHIAAIAAVVAHRDRQRVRVAPEQDGLGGRDAARSLPAWRLAGRWAQMRKG